METKPFNLQSPEQIAKDYGGNKQKIAQAASMGMVDPTAAVLAGMFIDRIRSAQMMEQQPQGTVAQQVFQPQQAPMAAPQAPPMGAPPPMAAPQAPPMGAPPMGAPPMGAPPMGAPQAPPMQPPGMAMGGLMDLSVPDDMFEEPVTDAQNFAGGGLVAFAEGALVQEDDEYGIGDLMRQMFTPTAAEQKASYEALRGAGRVKKEQDRPRAEAKKGRDAPPIGDSSVFMPPGLMAQGSFGTPRAFPGQGAAPTITAPVPEYGTGDMLRQMFTPDAKDQKFAYDSLRAVGRDSKPPAKREAAPERRAPPARGAPAPMMGDSSAFLPPSLMAQGSFDAPRSFAATPQAMPAAATAAPTSPRAPMAAPTAAAPRGLGELAATQGAAPRVASAPVPGAPVAPGAPAGPSGLEGNMELHQRLMGPQAATPEREAYAAMMRQQMSPEAMAAQKKQDMWQALAQFGFGMAGTNSPSFMQAAGQAGAATVPAMAAMTKARKATEREARKWLVDNENMTNAEARALKAQEITFSQAREAVEEQRRQFDAKMTQDESQFTRSLAARAAGGGGGGRGGDSGGGMPDFPGGEFGAFATSRYQDIMALMGDKLKADPRAMAAYTTDPAGYVARYKRVAYREALRLGKQDAEGKGGPPPRRGAPTPTSGGSGGPPSSMANMSNEEFIAKAKKAGVL